MTGGAEVTPLRTPGCLMSRLKREIQRHHAGRFSATMLVGSCLIRLHLNLHIVGWIQSEGANVIKEDSTALVAALIQVGGNMCDTDFADHARARGVKAHNALKNASGSVPRESFTTCAFTSMLRKTRYHLMQNDALPCRLKFVGVNPVMTSSTVSRVRALMEMVRSMQRFTSSCIFAAVCAVSTGTQTAREDLSDQGTS